MTEAVVFPEFTEFEESAETCPHNNLEKKGGKRICVDCFEVLEEELTYTKDDTAAFGPNRSCAGRVTTRGVEKRNIFKDLGGISLPENIIESANAKYQKIMEKVGGECAIKRKKKRKGVIIVCTQMALKEHGEKRSVHDVARLFEGDIQKKAISYGLKKYCKVFRESLTEYTQVSDLIQRTINLCKIPPSKYDEILEICLSVQGKTRVLKSAKPQSVASAVVFLWQTMNKDKPWACYVPKKEFAKIVCLSEATITKHAEEVIRYLGLDVKI
ncbi:putative transcription initiation factor TFIIB [Insectomime virus]|uniref:Putative transcription initiation factor TFIIB n=1 Tax=Tunisvirus fontaine2 TaxID=1421067 RepID=V9SGE5_9VIRU|nr:putative transcription initiation factor TFIIB [Tunisvirus fontaine2]AHA46100.1 putative transcription initiation factor TFIIB [Insectomime virus]AHC54832.1 putative transcription initiation factor TFIIB [Tunisvirus fontaine2]